MHARRPAAATSAARSQATRLGGAAARPARGRRCDTRSRPPVPTTVVPARTGRPAARAASTSAPAGAARRSAMAAIVDAGARAGRARRDRRRHARWRPPRGGRAHAVAVDVGARGVGQHDAGPVVAGKHQRPLDARRSRARPRAPAPATAARAAARGTGAARWSVTRSRQADDIVREIAERGGARQQRHARMRGQRRQRSPRATPAPAARRSWRRFVPAASRRTRPARRTG